MMDYQQFTQLRRDDLLCEADRMRLARLAQGKRETASVATVLRLLTGRVLSARPALSAPRPTPAACATCPA